MKHLKKALGAFFIKEQRGTLDSEKILFLAQIIAFSVTRFGCRYKATASNKGDYLKMKFLDAQKNRTWVAFEFEPCNFITFLTWFRANVTIEIILPWLYLTGVVYLSELCINIDISRIRSSITKFGEEYIIYQIHELHAYNMNMVLVSQHYII